jgi:hypothetical protein
MLEDGESRKLKGRPRTVCLRVRVPSSWLMPRAVY